MREVMSHESHASPGAPPPRSCCTRAGSCSVPSRRNSRSSVQGGEEEGGGDGAPFSSTPSWTHPPIASPRSVALIGPPSPTHIAQTIDDLPLPFGPMMQLSFPGSAVSSADLGAAARRGRRPARAARRADGTQRRGCEAGAGAAGARVRHEVAELDADDGAFGVGPAPLGRRLVLRIRVAYSRHDQKRRWLAGN